MDELGEMVFLMDQHVSSSQLLSYWSRKNSVYLALVIMWKVMTEIQQSAAMLSAMSKTET